MALPPAITLVDCPKACNHKLLHLLLLVLLLLLLLLLFGCKSGTWCAGRAGLDRQCQGSREAAHADRGRPTLRWVTPSALASMFS